MSKWLSEDSNIRKPLVLFFLFLKVLKMVTVSGYSAVKVLKW